MADIDLEILVVDDDFTQLELFSTLVGSISEPRCSLELEKDPHRAMERITQKNFDVVITDYSMGAFSGQEVFARVREINPDLPVVIVTALQDIDLAISMMREGVHDFLVKPLKRDILQNLLSKIFDHILLEREVSQLRLQVNQRFSIESIIGRSKAIMQVIESIGRCSDYLVNVLIRGESGSGKELVAHALHHTSPRAEKPFIVLNIAALSESLIESELFGHVKGAFTGAERDRIGRFEEANNGTLFIDEIGDVSPAVQVKLLRAIQFKEYQLLGSNDTRTADVRIIAATSRNLEELMDKGQFRADLFYRLNVVEIQVPPLRDRKEDIPLLVDYFSEKMEEKQGIPKKNLSREAMHSLMVYDYPGNVRELENIMERGMVFSRGEMITSRDLPAHLQSSNAGSENLDLSDGFDRIMENFEGRILREALEASSWNQSQAARSLGIGERRLRYRMEKLGIHRTP